MSATPNVYPIPTLNQYGSMAIAMDHFTFVDMSKYRKEVVLRLLCRRPAYKKEAWDEQQQRVILQHSCAEPTPTNIMDWRREIKEELFGAEFRLRMNDAFNENMRDLMNPEENDDGTDQLSFGFGIHKPITKKDVENLLFENDGDCVRIMKRCGYAQVISLLYMWAYYPFLERSPDDWVKKGI